MYELRGIDDSIRNHAALCVEWARGHGVPVTITSTYRSEAEQRKLYERYQRCVRDGLYPWAAGCKYPAARPGRSAHQFGLAWDSTVPDIYSYWWAGVRRQVGFHVPGNDAIHAEHPQFQAWLSQA